MATRGRRSAGFRTLGDLEESARNRVPPDVWGYIEGGAGGERTRRGNESAFARWCLRPRVLAGVRSVDLSTSVLGQSVAAPFFVAPMAYQREISPEGELATAAAAASLGVLGVYSTLSSDSIEAIASVAPVGPRWFQLYLQPELSRSLKLVQRAERAGCSAIVLTVDTPVLGSRDRQARSGFALGRPLPVGNGRAVRSPPRGPTWDGQRYALDPAAGETWKTLDAVRGATKLPLVVKGVLTPEAAVQAAAHGARAVIVSNHGGRQLDLAAASLDALPAIVRAVGRRVEVYLDGGVRRGSDVTVALALGARAVGVGRPVLWALAAGGRLGVERYLRLLGTELANTLLLLGRASVGEIDRTVVGPSP
jgi:4-hydroxymandelate oxidase